ncbi:MAG TPA: hypothetical protein VNU19_02490 [Candidatus Acidoferrum sp.]|jgi:hypothetical protein|nr:hypothetical protein [Candidatus Acidoferrum sp.]
MNRRTLADRVGIVAGVATVLIAGGVWIYVAFFTPVDDPRFFCQLPVASPVSIVAPYAVLQNCAADKTFTVAKGGIIAVDVTDYFGVDSGGPEWTGLTVSDGHVLTTVRPSVIIDSQDSRIDEVAVYRAAQAGEATLRAVDRACGADTGPCRPGFLWRVTVRVI